MEIKEKLTKLRQLMSEAELDAYIIPSFDPHHSEYVAEYFKCRQWVSGFTGSAGTVVITAESAGLWTDGRYSIQAEQQLENLGIQLFKMADPGVPSYPDWLKETLRERACVGFDGNVFSVAMVQEMQKAFAAKAITLRPDRDLIGELWNDRPESPDGPLFIHDVMYAGKSRVEKLKIIRADMREKGASHYLLTSLDDIA